MEPRIRYVRTTDGVTIAFWSGASSRCPFDCQPRADAQNERGFEEPVRVFEVRWKDEAQP
jgi:hypothetical protein